jgi:hypothetical protein
MPLLDGGGTTVTWTAFKPNPKSKAYKLGFKDSDKYWRGNFKRLVPNPYPAGSDDSKNYIAGADAAWEIINEHDNKIEELLKPFYEALNGRDGGLYEMLHEVQGQPYWAFEEQTGLPKKISKEVLATWGTIKINDAAWKKGLKKAIAILENQKIIG